MAGGVSANVALGSLGDDLNQARDQATRDPQVPGTPGSNPTYAKGALVAAAVAPGLAPFVGARVGIGNHFEGGLAYTGRGARVDVRRSFDQGRVSYSVGLGLSAALYGRQQGGNLPNVDLGVLHGYGADLPLLVGWEDNGGIYKVWGGVRAGFERVILETLRSEPRPPTAGSPIALDANRFWGGPLVGIAAGLGHVHVGIEIAAAYHVVVGTYNANNVTVRGVSLTPASALWWTF